MADSDDEIYIDVVPRVDDAAADSAVEKLKGKFKDVAGDIGGEFMDALNGSGALEDLGKKVGESLSGPLKDLSEGTGLDLKNPLEKMLKQDMGGALDDIAGQLGGKLAKAISDPLHDVASSVGIDLDTAVDKALNKDWGGLGTILGKGVGGKLGDVLGINDLLGPDGLDGVLDKAHSVADTVKSFKGGDLSSGLKGITSLFGADAQATPLHDQLQQFTDTSTDVHSLFQGPDGQSALPKGLDKFFEKLPVVGDVEQSVEQLLNQAHQSIPSTNIDPDKNPHGLWGSFFGVASNLMPWVHDKPTAAPQENSTDRLYNSVFGGEGGGGASSGTANEVDVQSSVATVSAGSVTLGGSISIPASMTAGGASTAPHVSSSGIGASAGDGGLASLYGSGSGIGKAGYSTGGVLPGSSPGTDNMIGILPGGQAVGLEGGEGVINPSAMSRPGIADLVSSLNQHYDAGTGVSGIGGDPNNPTLSMPPTQGNAPPQQQQLGTGSGGGVSGGGLIGMGEQAGAMAAGAMSFGAGAIPAQMAEQQMNLATQKMTQMASTLAAAPFEEFGLAGGQMGAPSVNVMGGWPGKLLSGLIGQQFSSPNTAGLGAQVQPPKQPNQQQNPEDPAADPANGNKSQQSAPKGTSDDPMHITNVTPAPSPPQQAATSAMNYGALSGLTLA